MVRTNVVSRETDKNRPDNDISPQDMWMEIYGRIDAKTWQIIDPSQFVSKVLVHRKGDRLIAQVASEKRSRREWEIAGAGLRRRQIPAVWNTARKAYALEEIYECGHEIVSRETILLILRHIVM